ncbi:MAG: hypothetical protein ACPGUD_05335 [Parashewanella sp.]
MQLVKRKSLISKARDLYQEFTTDNKITYRLVELTEVEGVKYAIICMRYSHYIFKIEVKEVLSDLRWLSCISQLDVRNLTIYLFYSPQPKSPRFSLQSILFYLTEITTFVIKDKKQSELRRVTFEELRNDKELLENFEGSHLLEIGYICGLKSK